VLQRRVNANGVVYYASPLLEAMGVRHAFSTRLGGVSQGPFASLNLGNPNRCAVQDDRRRIEANYALLLSGISCPGGIPLRVHQVHGNAVACVNPGEAFDVHQKADALLSRDAGRVISVRTADCAAVLLAGEGGKTVAVVHAGWRGIVAGVIAATVRRLGGRAADHVAAIGPCISRDAFDVGSEVLDPFAALFGSESPIDRGDGKRGKADLRAAARLQLLACGLEADQIDGTDRCTVKHEEEFFSHRRDRGVTGRMAAVIAANA